MSQLRVRSCAVGIGGALGDDALEPELAGRSEEFRAVLGDVLAVADGRRRVLEQPLEQRFALDERHARQIPAVEMQQIESDEHDLGARARQRVLQTLEARDAARVVDDGFAVDERRAARQRAGRRRDGFEALGPIVAAACQHRGVPVLDSTQHAIAVELRLE